MAASTIAGDFINPDVYRDTALTSTAVYATTVPATLTGWNIINPNSADVYVKFCDRASGVIVGTTAIVRTLLIPGASTVYLEHNKISGQGAFSKGISLFCTTLIADTDTTAPGTAIQLCIFYKKV